MHNVASTTFLFFSPMPMPMPIQGEGRAWPTVPSNIPGPPNRVGIGFRISRMLGRMHANHALGTRGA